MKPGQRFIPNKSNLLNGDGKQFVRIPFAILENPNLTSFEKILWGRLAFYAGDNGRCYPDLDEIAHSVGSSRSGVKKALKSLRDKNFIDWVTPDHKDRAKRKGFANEYFFIWNQELGYKARSKSNPAFESEENTDINEKQELGYKARSQMNPANGKSKVTSGQKQGYFRTKARLQSDPQNKRKTKEKHTDAREAEVNPKSVCVSDSFFSENGNAEEKNTSEGGQGNKNHLTALQQEYIQFASSGKDNPAAYRAHLTKLAKRGELEFTEEELARLRDNSFVRPNLLGDMNEPSEVQHGMDLDGESIKVDEQDRQDQQQVRECFDAGIEYGNSLQELCDSVFLDDCDFGLDLPVGRIESALLVVHPDEAKLAQRKAAQVENVRQHSQGGPFGESLLPNALRQLKKLDPDLAAKVEAEQSLDLDRKTQFERCQTEIENLNGRIEEYTNRLHQEEDKDTVELLRRQIKMDGDRLSEIGKNSERVEPKQPEWM